MSENLDPKMPESTPSETQLPVEKTEQVEITATQPESKSKNEPLSKDEIIEKLKNITLQAELPPRSEVEALKQAFYKIRSADVEAERIAFVNEGNEIESFVANPNPSEDVLKTFLNEIKEKRAKQIAEEEKDKEDNYKKKLQIIEDIKGLTASSEDFNKLYRDFKDLQQKWNEITFIPQAKERELWTAYQVQSESFYDLIKINNEFRDYDFKKNLELKTAICESAEKLLEEPDSVSAFHQLQNFHKQWREIGPVSKALREDLWNRFKVVSTAINKNYQTHFEGLKEQEEQNLVKKTEICNALKSINYESLASFKDWDDKSKEVIELQSTWKTIGFVPRKINTQIFEEFRSLCDKFFAKKSEFFKKVRSEMDENLEKKRALCEKAKELKDSTDWKKTTDELIAIQKEWKTVGAVPRRYSDQIWKEFVGACDYFFEQKKKNTTSKEDEVANLTLKKEIVEKILAIDEALPPAEAIAKVRELSDEWNAIGFVPFKEKDKAYKAFHKAVDAHYDRLRMNKSERRMEAFKSNVEDIAKHDNPTRVLLKERDHLMHQYNRLKGDLQTYENNMSFLSISSKGAGGLLKEVNSKIESLKNEIDLIYEKVTTIDEKIKEME